MSVKTGFSPKLLVTERTFKRISDAFMDDSHVAPQFALFLENLATLRAWICVNFTNWSDALMHKLLMCFQTIVIGKMSSTDLTGDDDTTIVNLHVCLVKAGLHKLVATDVTGMFVLGLALMNNSDMLLQ